MTMRILIVDQFAPFRRDIARYLALLGECYEVVGEAASDEGAIAQVARLRPDIVLLDIDLPDRNGIQTARHIRSTWPDTRVLIVTHHPEAEYRCAALDAGAAQVVDKLAIVEQLPRALVALARQAEAAIVDETREAPPPPPNQAANSSLQAP